jgi:hypothetical protein
METATGGIAMNKRVGPLQQQRILRQSNSASCW